LNNSNIIDVRELIDRLPIGRFQWLIVGLGFCVIALDGFDTVVMGYVAPELVRVWGVTRSSLGPVMSAALIGLALGALIAGPLADRFGRKIVLVISVAFFGASTLASSCAPDIPWLIALRFLTGIGLGAAMPNAVTFVSEYAPKRNRSFLVTIAFSGFMVGGSAGGAIAAGMIPTFGWRSVLMIGGVLPLGITPLLLLKLPESALLLLTKGVPSMKIRRIIDRLAPGVANDQSIFRMADPETRLTNPIGVILSRPLRVGTLMLWVSYFMGLFPSYLLSGWLPTLAKGVGFSVSEAAMMTSLFHLGGAVGIVFFGWIMDRMNPHRLISITFLLSGVLIFLMGTAPHSFALLAVLSCGAGLALNSATIAMNPLAVTFYPTEARATGTSWMHGMGRLGAILSAFAGAGMMGANWTFQQAFAVLTIPTAIAAIAVIIKGMSGKSVAPTVPKSIKDVAPPGIR
jgi:AAHS family 4-hydroxybenzoate transporter-like MFS transporter